MAWNPSPEVAVARDAAERLDADQVVIVYINQDKGTFGMASFGKTRELCKEAGKLGNRLYERTRQFFEE